MAYNVNETNGLGWTSLYWYGSGTQVEEPEMPVYEEPEALEEISDEERAKLEVAARNAEGTKRLAQYLNRASSDGARPLSEARKAELIKLFSEANPDVPLDLGNFPLSETVSEERVSNNKGETVTVSRRRFDGNKDAAEASKRLRHNARAKERFEKFNAPGGGRAQYEQALKNYEEEKRRFDRAQRLGQTEHLSPSVLMTSEQHLDELRYIDAESKALGDLIGFDRQAESAEQQARWDYALRQNKELEHRARNLNESISKIRGKEMLVEYYTPDGAVYLKASDGDALTQLEKEMATRGFERGKDWGKVEHFNVRGVIDAYGNVLANAPIHVAMKEGDKVAESIKQFAAANKDMNGMLLPEMFEALGIPLDEVSERANTGITVAQNIEEDRKQGKRALGKMDLSENERRRMGYGGVTLEEMNGGSGAFGKFVNWSRSINPLANLADEYGQATEAELGTPEGLEEMRRRVANGEDTLTWGERVALGLIGDPGEAILKDPEAAYNYIVNRRLKRMDAAENAELRGTTFGADVAEMTETSAMMGLEFAGINTLTGGGAVVSRAGKTLTTGQQALRGAAAMGTEAILHAPAKARQLMADKVAFNPVTNQLEVVGEGEGAVTATLKGVAAPMLEYATEMYAMRLLWNPVGRGLKRVTPTRVKDFTKNLVTKAKGTQAAHWLDSVVVSPGLDTVRKISERTGFHISPMGVFLEEPILEEIPANVLSAMFNLEGTSERESGLWGQASGGATDAWDALVETVKNAPAMMTSTLLFGGGTGMAVKGTTGLINYNMSKPRVVAALRELGATDAEMKGKDKAALNDLLFEKLRNIKTDPKFHLAVYSPEEIAKMPRETLERKLREFGWADMDLSGVSEEQMRTRLLNGFKEMGNAAWTDRAIAKLTTGLYAAARRGMNHSNILERLEADIFEKAPMAFDAETRERMREVMLLRSMAGSGQYRGTLAGSLMADQSMRLYASLGNEAQQALDTFEDGFMAARQTAVPTYEQIGTGAYQPSTFRQPMQESEMRNNGRGGYTDPNTGISITPIYAEGSKTPRYRVDIDPSTVTQTTIGSVDAELAKMGIRAPRVRLPMGLQNIFDNLQDARKFADRISSYSNTLKQELVTKAKAAQSMYARVRGKNGNGIVTLARPADAPAAIRDEMMDALIGSRQEGEDSTDLMHRFQTVMGFTSAQDGKTYVFLDNHSSPYSLLQTVQHEGFHEGLLSAFLGDRKQVESFIQELTDSRNGFPAWVSENAKKLKNPRDVEEFLAALAETMNAGPGFFHSVNRAMRKAMALNGNIAPSEMDVNNIIYGAWKAQRMTPDMMPKPREASGSFAKVSGINGPVEDMGGAVDQKFGPAISREDTDRAVLERDRAMAKKSDKKDEAGKDEKSAKKDKPEKPKPEEEGKPEEKGEEEAPTEEKPTADDGDVKPDLGEDEGETVTDLDEEPEKGGEAPEGKPEQKEEKPEEPPTKEPEPEPAPTTPPPPKAPGKKPRKGQVTSTDELQPEEEEKPTEAAEPPKTEPEAKPEPKPEPVANGTVRNGRIAWDGKWLKPGGIRGHQGVFISDTEDGEPLAFFQTEDWGLGDKETRPMRRGAPVADHYTAAVKWKAAGMPGLEEAKAQLPVEDVDGAVSEDGYIRWEKFWLKPGTHNGEEGYFIHDERGGQAKGFYKPGAWRTKAGKERPGKVTNFVDDKLTGERVSAAYRWSKHEKMLEEQAKKQAPQPEQPHETPAPQAEPEAQEPQETPAPPPQPEQATEPETTQEAPTLKVLKEDEDGRSVHVSTKGITNTKRSGRFFEEMAAVKEAAVRAGLAPQDAITVGVDTNGAVVAFDEDAETLENVAPTYMPVTMVVGGETHQVYAVKWSDPEVAGAIVDFFDKHTVVTVDRRNNAAKITKPKNWEQQVEPQQAQAEPTQEPLAQREPQAQADALTYEALLSLPPNEAATALATGKISTEQLLEYVKTDPWQHLQVAELVWQDKHEASERGIPYIANARVKVPPTAEAIIEILHSRLGPARLVEKKRPPDETDVKRPEKAKKPTARPAKPQSKKPRATKEEQAALDELNDLLGGIGMLRGGEENNNRPGRRIRSFQTSHTDASPELNLGTTPSVNQSDAHIITNPIADVGAKIETLEKIRKTLRAPALRGGTIAINGGNVAVSVATALGLKRGSPTSWYGSFSPVEAADRTVNLRVSDHPVKVSNVELIDKGDMVSLVIHSFPRKLLRPLGQSAKNVKEYRYSKREMDSQRIRTFLGDVESLLRTGAFPNVSNGSLITTTPPQTGMARSGAELTPEQTTQVQNAMNKVVDASVRTANVRTFREMARRLFEMLRDSNRKLWDAMKRFLRNAWNQYGDLHEDLGLDEVSRAEATRIFDELENGTIEASQEPTKENDDGRIQPSPSQSGGGLDGHTAGGVGDPDESHEPSVPVGRTPGRNPDGVPAGLAGQQPAETDEDDTGRTGGRVSERNPDGATVSGTPVPVRTSGSSGGVRPGNHAAPSASGVGGGGTSEAEPDGVPSQTQGSVVPARNYVIPEHATYKFANKRERVKANIDALRLLNSIGARNATPEEQRILARYSGWGNLGQEVFDEENPDFEKEREELKQLLSKEEYEGARRSTQYAHYTPVYVVRAIYDALLGVGVKGNNLNIFEAGVGSGRFIGALPESIRESNYSGVEMDSVSIRLLEKLYPKANIVKKPYQELPARHGTEDVVVGNPPYGTLKPYDNDFQEANGATLHNFFIMKQIEALRPGGIGAFVVSHNFLDNKNPRWREWIHRRAQLVAALRLPSSTFSSDANTDVVTDIVIFRKRVPNEEVPSRDDPSGEWLDVVPVHLDPGIHGQWDPDERPAVANKFLTKTVERRKYRSKNTEAKNVFDEDKLLGEPSFSLSTRYSKEGEVEVSILLRDGTEITQKDISKRLLDQHIYPSMSGALFDAGRLIGELFGGGKAQTLGEPVAKIGGGGVHPSLRVGANFVGADGKLYLAAKDKTGAIVGIPVKDYDDKAERVAYAKNPVKVTKIVKDKETGEPQKVEKTQTFSRWRHVPYANSKLTPREQEVMRALVKLREVRYDLVQEELKEDASEDVMADLRKQLNEAYDAYQAVASGFASKKGEIAYLSTSSAVFNILAGDPASSQILGLETVERDPDTGNAVAIKKSAIFYRRVNMPPWKPADHYDSTLDALVACVNSQGQFDVNWVAERTGKTKEAIVQELGDRVYTEPDTGRVVLAEDYLSGDVRTKLETAKTAVANGETEYSRNVDALTKVLPPDVKTVDVYLPFGSQLLTPEIIGEFGYEALGLTTRFSINAEYIDIKGIWSVKLPREAVTPETKAAYPSGGASFQKLFEAALNKTNVIVYQDTEPGEKRVVDVKATKIANDTVEKIRDKWESWWKTSRFADGLTRAYNERFNRYARAHYDGGFLGVDKNLPITLYQHQRDAIWRAILTHNAYFNHVVGAGKTFTALVSIMELHRMGQAKKPLVVVPNHLVEQWRKDALLLYPGANILATGEDDYSATNRQRTMARIQNGEYDLVILPHSQLKYLPVSPDALISYTDRAINNLRLALENAKAGKKKSTVSAIEARIEALKERLKKLIEEMKKNQDDTGVYFDTMGIDALVIDEAHEFKNVPFTSILKTKGLGNPEGSTQAFDLMTKVRILRNNKPNAPLIMMSGTPVSNSLTELYHVINYMNPEALAKAGIYSMDAFLGAFGNIANDFEVDSVGRFKGDVSRLRSIVNVGDLMSIVLSFMDELGGDRLRESMEAVGKVYKVPPVETISVAAERSPAQTRMFGEEIKVVTPDGNEHIDFTPGSILWRALHMKELFPHDNMLNVTTDAALVSLDPRLRDLGAADFAGSKVNLCVDNVVEEYKRYDKVKGTQLIFCDNGTPKPVNQAAKDRLAIARKELEAARDEWDKSGGTKLPAEVDPKKPDSKLTLGERVVRLEEKVRQLAKDAEERFSVYDDIREKLVAKGIPRSEIAFIGEYDKSGDEKQRLFNLVNEGKIRILIGSSKKMGAGMNANMRMVALHHLDVPWRPSDLEQRNGRIIRQGNVLMDEVPDFRVHIYQYTTKQTGDAFKWDMVKNKWKAFAGIWSAPPSLREIEDISEGALNAETMVASGMASPFMFHAVGLRRKEGALSKQRNRYYATRSSTETALENALAQGDILKDNLERFSNAASLVQPRVQDPNNWYAGIIITDKPGNNPTQITSTLKDRKASGEKTLAATIFSPHIYSGGKNINYRGFEWSISWAKEVGEEHEVILSAYPPPAENEDFWGRDKRKRRGLFPTTKFTVETVSDEALIARMDNAIKRVEQSIPEMEAGIARNAESVSTLKADLEKMPESFPEEKELKALTQELADLDHVIHRGAKTVEDAQRLLDEKNGEGKTPSYEWLQPGFTDKKTDESQIGMTRNAALHDEAWQERRLETRRAKMAEHRNAEIRRFYDDVRRVYNDKTLPLVERDKALSRMFVKIGDPTPRLVAAIREAEGFATDDFEIKLYGNHVIHLWKRHGGGHGSADGSMSDPHDVELLEYLFQHFDSVGILLGKDGKPIRSNSYLHSDGTRPKQLVVSARINGVFYGSMVAIDSKRKEIRVTSAYKGSMDGVKQRIIVSGDPAFTPPSAIEGENIGAPTRNATQGNLAYTSETGSASSDNARVLSPNAMENGQGGSTTKGSTASPGNTTIPNQNEEVNKNPPGMARGGWEKELQKKLDEAGITEADLSAASQAYIAAKRAHEGAMPRSRIGKMVDFVGEVITPREGETRREFIKRKGHEAAENLGKKLVDVRIPLINAVKEIVGDEVLPEDEDIATAMQLSYGRITAQHADIDADYVRPVLDILVKQGLQVSDLDIYLSAKFAPERNKMIQERAEWKDAGAGISDEEAAARLRGMQEQFTKTQMAELEKAAQIVYKMNRANLARLVESGILPQKQVEEWVKLSPHYVPLRDDLERLGAADVSGSMKHGRPFQKAVGRYSEALDSSFGWSVIQAKQGVIWAEQNRINKITVNFAKNHLSPEDYFVSKVPIKAEKVFSERKGYKQEDAVPLRLDRPDERNIAEQYLKAGYTVVRSSENRNIVWVDGGEMDRVLRVRKGTDARRTSMPQNVVARIDGKRVYVFFDETKGSRGNKMGLAINRANMVHWDNRLWNTIAWLTRMKAMASTVWSVTFAARNAINDILQTSGITLMEGKYGVTKDVFKNYGQALKAFTAWRVSGQYDESTEMGAYLKEAVKQGMLTGIYGKSSNFDQTMLDSVIAPLAVLEHRTGFGKNVKDTVAYSWSQVLAATSTFSEIPEVGVRLAVYAAMRQHGATATEAAVYAREITLDYNKKGEWTPVTNTLWMFSNASIQSLARWKKAWQTGNWKSRTIGVTFLLAAGFFTQLYNIMFASLFFGGDDDELYKNIPDYAYDNSIPILLPGGKSYLTIPNRGPQAAITRIGASLANLLVGDETPTGFLSDASVVLNPAFLENANPAGSSGSFLQTVSPTILDPAIQLAENKAWTGAPVHAMDYGNSAAPKWQDGFEKTSPFSKWLARLLSDATGGDDVQGGKIDVYPEQVELVKNFIIGSIGTDFSGLSDMARGDFGNMPVMRGFVRPLPDNTHRYYEIKADVEKNLQIMQGYAVSSREKYERHLEQHPYLLNAKGFRRVKTAIEKLVDLRREQLALGQDTSETDKLLEEYRQLYIDFYEGKM